MKSVGARYDDNDDDGGDDDGDDDSDTTCEKAASWLIVDVDRDSKMD